MKPIPYDPMQVYYNRDSVAFLLTEEMFKALNEFESGAVSLACCGCIDALDSMPAGAMHSTVGKFEDYITPNYFYRSDLAHDIGPVERRRRIEQVKQLFKDLDFEAG